MVGIRVAALSRVELEVHTHPGELPHMVTQHVVTQGHMGKDSPDSQCHSFQYVPQSVLTILVPFTVAKLFSLQLIRIATSG